MELTYRTEGDYLIPNLTLPAEEPVTLGKYAHLRRRYLKQHRRILYTHLLTTCTFNQHLAEIEQTANERMEQIVAQMAAQQGVTESLKRMIKTEQSQAVTVDAFLEVVRHYTSAETLNTRMITELISHIEVHHAEK